MFYEQKIDERQYFCTRCIVSKTHPASFLSIIFSSKFFQNIQLLGNNFFRTIPLKRDKLLVTWFLEMNMVLSIDFYTEFCHFIYGSWLLTRSHQQTIINILVGSRRFRTIFQIVFKWLVVFESKKCVYLSFNLHIDLVI